MRGEEQHMSSVTYFALASTAVFGPIKNPKASDSWEASYSCVYSLPDSKGKPNSKGNPYFISGTDDDKIEQRRVLINFEGKDIAFTLKDASPKAQKKKKSDKTETREYVADKMKLKVEFVVTEVCVKKTGCEADTKKVVLTLDAGGRSYKTSLKGYCAF